jgi:protein tyrosine phosphatase (PTP) superfamily phosphohydrolase (DUF442 family)
MQIQQQTKGAKMKKILALTILLFLASCISSPTIEKISTTTIGQSLEAKKYSNIYFSAQPSDQDLNQLKADGFALVINLRAPSEHDVTREKKLVESLKMKYANIPFNMDKPLDDDYISKVVKVVAANRTDGKILIHCSSGNRVGVWAGAHFFKDHKYSKAKSVKVAETIGVNNPKAMQKLESYLSTK